MMTNAMALRPSYWASVSGGKDSLFTPEIDGLTQNWDIGGGRCTATHHTGDRSEDGSERHTKNRAGARTRS